MYAIANICYGIPLRSNGRAVTPQVIENAIEDVVAGFESYYSGAGFGGPPAFFGVKLGEFDEACSYVELHSLPLSPTSEQTAEFVRLWNALDPSMRKAIAEFAGSSTPRVFILWSTS